MNPSNLPAGTPVLVPSAHGQARQATTAGEPFTWSGMTLVAVSGLAGACQCPVCKRAAPALFETRAIELAAAPE